MLKATISFVLFAAMAGCTGLTQTVHYVDWTANLNSLPALDCVQNTIKSTTSISLVDFKHEERRSKTSKEYWHFGIHVDSIPTTGSRMALHLVEDYNGHVLFDLVYGDQTQYDGIRQLAAQNIMANISRVCGVPELSERARLVLRGDWLPEPFAFGK